MTNNRNLKIEFVNDTLLDFVNDLEIILDTIKY
jgi:hypothetical protein